MPVPNIVAMVTKSVKRRAKILTSEWFTGDKPNCQYFSSNNIISNFDIIFVNVTLLTHLRLVSLLWDIGKQNSPRCDAAFCGVPSGAILFAYRIFIEKIEQNLKITPDAPKNESGLPQMIMMGNFIRQI